MLVEQLQRVPLFRVMTCRQDDTSGGFLTRNGQLRGRRRRQTDINHIVPHTHQRAAYDLLHHWSAQTRITSHYNRVVIRHRCATLGGVSCRKTNDIHRVQTLTHATTDRAADTGNRFN